MVIEGLEARRLVVHDEGRGTDEEAPLPRRLRVEEVEDRIVEAEDAALKGALDVRQERRDGILADAEHNLLVRHRQAQVRRRPAV